MQCQGNVTAALKQTGLWADTLVIFSTDNGGPADNYDHNMASNWPLRGTKGTLFDGGVRGVGIVSGGAVPLDRRGMVLKGLVHVSDWFHTIVSYAGINPRPPPPPLQQQQRAPAAPAAPAAPGSGRVVTVTPPFQLGDGQDMLAYFMTGGTSTASSPRMEVLHEAHPHNSTDGIGNALRAIVNGVQWKVVLRTGRAWPGNFTNGGSSDGWYGGLNSTDKALDGYSLPINKTTQNWTVTCSVPPASVSRNFACGAVRGAGADTPDRACLFNMDVDPCEFADQSSSNPTILQHMLGRLDVYRATAVYGPSATANPDGLGCPAVKVIKGCTGNGADAPMSCSAKLPCG